MKRKLMVATHNKGKLKEIRMFLSDLNMDIVSLDEAINAPNIVEDGKTFMENAFKKAKVIAQATGIMTLADDSGLEVDALDGAPGVRSARYSGENASDALNNEKLLEDLKGVASDQRSAHFRCVIVVYHPSGRWISTEAKCDGEITQNFIGEGGFGYDPVFYVPSVKRTMAQLSPEEKNRLSHRGKALAEIKAKLPGFLDSLESNLKK
jgi:XTP/dITP diphosphohydrolase